MNDTKKPVLMSFRPQWASAILNGQKTIEFRRVRVRFGKGSRLLIYESSPTCALVGYAAVRQVEVLDEDQFSSVHGATHRASSAEEYLKGCGRYSAIHLSKVVRFEVPLSLSDIRDNAPGWTPPQSYRYMHPKSNDEMLLRYAKFSFAVGAVDRVSP